MSLFYVYAGIKHFSDTDYFLKIMPPYFPYHQGLVYLSGAFEFLFGILLIFKKTRFLACWGLILLLFIDMFVIVFVLFGPVLNN